MSRCSSCGAEITWCRTTSGARMPLDAAPDPAGLFVLEHGVASRVIDAQNLDRYTSHFATCPNANEHRSKR